MKSFSRLSRRDCYRKSKYGISPEQFRDISKKQFNRCAICGILLGGAFLGGSTPYIDHNHDTGEVRGLLCRKCNLGLGLFSDDYETLVAAAHYLEPFEKAKLLREQRMITEQIIILPNTLDVSK